MNEDELLSFDYRCPNINSWCKLGTKISGFNNNATGKIVDFAKYKTKTVVYIEWNDKKLNTSSGYRKYEMDYLNQEIQKGNIKLKNDQ